MRVVSENKQDCCEFKDIAQLCLLCDKGKHDYMTVFERNNTDGDLSQYNGRQFRGL